MPHLAYIGLGSNLGDREATIDAAVRMLRSDPRVSGVRHSGWQETEPVGGPADQGWYLNGAVEVATDLEPEQLLDLLQSIEAALGRQRQVRWGPRTIDLDLLLFDDRVIDLPGLQLPHPRMAERRFVLAPLVEIAPGAIHPLLRLSVADLLRRLDQP